MPHAFQAAFGKWVSQNGEVIGGEHQCTGRTPGIPPRVLAFCRPDGAILNLDCGSWRQYPWLETGGFITFTQLIPGDELNAAEVWTFISKQTGVPEREGGRFFHHCWFWAVPTQDWDWSYLAFLNTLNARPLVITEGRTAPTAPLDLPTVELRPLAGRGLIPSERSDLLDRISKGLKAFLPDSKPHPWEVSIPKGIGLIDAFENWFLPVLCALPNTIRNRVNIALGFASRNSTGLYFIMREGSQVTWIQPKIPDETWWLERHLSELSEEIEDADTLTDLALMVDMRCGASRQWKGLSSCGLAELLQNWQQLLDEDEFVLGIKRHLRAGADAPEPPKKPLRWRAASTLHALWGAIEKLHGKTSHEFVELLAESLNWIGSIESIPLTSSDNAGHRLLREIIALRWRGSGIFPDEAPPLTLVELEKCNSLPPFKALRDSPAMNELRVSLHEVANTRLAQSIPQNEGGNSASDWISLLPRIPRGTWLFEWLTQHAGDVLTAVITRWVRPESPREAYIALLEPLVQSSAGAYILGEVSMSMALSSPDLFSSAYKCDPAIAVFDVLFQHRDADTCWRLLQAVEQARIQTGVVCEVGIRHPSRRSPEVLGELLVATRYQHIKRLPEDNPETFSLSVEGLLRSRDPLWRVTPSEVHDLLSCSAMCTVTPSLEVVQYKFITYLLGTPAGSWLAPLKTNYVTVLYRMALHIVGDNLQEPGNTRDAGKWLRLAILAALLQKALLESKPHSVDHGGVIDCFYSISTGQAIGLRPLQEADGRILFLLVEGLLKHPQWSLRKPTSEALVSRHPDPGSLGVWVFLTVARLRLLNRESEPECGFETKIRLWKAYALDSNDPLHGRSNRNIWLAFSSFASGIPGVDAELHSQRSEHPSARPAGSPKRWPSGWGVAIFLYLLKQNTNSRLPAPIVTDEDDEDAFKALGALPQLKLLASGVFRRSQSMREEVSDLVEKELSCLICTFVSDIRIENIRSRESITMHVGEFVNLGFTIREALLTRFDDDETRKVRVKVTKLLMKQNTGSTASDRSDHT